MATQRLRVIDIPPGEIYEHSVYCIDNINLQYGNLLHYAFLLLPHA